MGNILYSTYRGLGQRMSRRRPDSIRCQARAVGVRIAGALLVDLRLFDFFGIDKRVVLGNLQETR